MFSTAILVLGLALGATIAIPRGEPAETPNPPQAERVGSAIWAATDSLGRSLPTQAEVGPPRPDRTVALFYFLWHGEHIQGGPYDVTRILATDPAAMEKPASPLWGPLHAPHHWGESLFGYYLTDDAGVLRKHAQMLADAGVDVVFFDVTNQLTYPRWYGALLREWSAWRKLGNRTPQVAFLTPFWEPARVTRELWRDLYQPGLHPDLWFRWQGRPLILADPELLDQYDEQTRQSVPVELEPGGTLGQTIRAEHPFQAIGGRFPTWRTPEAAVTLTLRRDGPGGERLAAERFHGVDDNAWVLLRLKEPLPPGTYHLEASEPGGRIGWWSHPDDVDPRGSAEERGQAVPGDRTWRLARADEETRQIREFFTFRKPQPDYFRGPTRPDMWSWLEVHPQHVFTNSPGEKEQMSVGVAQNAVAARLGSMSEPGAHGRSWHRGGADQRPGAVWWGFNAAEQWERVLREDPRLVFITGWNEWIAGRFNEFAGVKRPVMFVDQFDHEHSRDIEPMRGGHGDTYYWQMVANIRRYKGVPEVEPVRAARIRIDGRFDDWREAGPVFRDTVGDPVSRRHRGWDTNVTYVNTTGRNDVVEARVAADRGRVAFLAKTAAPMTAPDGGDWMVLFLDLDADARTGWMGYDFVVNRAGPGRLERHAGGGRPRVFPREGEAPEEPAEGEFRWEDAGAVEWRMEAGGRQLEVAIPWRRLGKLGPPAELQFKWADHCLQDGRWWDFTLNGDAAPNDRFNYRARFEAPRVK